MWEQQEADAKKLAKELDISRRAANALVGSNFKSAKAIALLLGPQGHKLALIRNIGEKSCREIAWGLWKKGFLTYKLQMPLPGGQK